MFLENKSRNKKGNLIAQFLVLIIVATIMIIFVTSFGAKIWGVFFPNSDKSTLNNFEMLFNVINYNAVSEEDYESTPINIYLKEKYRILFFETNYVDCGYKSTDSNEKIMYYKPQACDNKDNLQCICLYKDEPIKELKSKDKNVVKCHTLSQNINFDSLEDPNLFFQLNRKGCNMGKSMNTESYNSYLIIKYNDYIDKKTVSRVYVLEDTEANRRINTELSIPRCSIKDDPLLKLCNRQKDGTVLGANSELDHTTNNAILGTISQECKKTGFNSTSIRCDFNNDKTTNDCIASCSFGDESNNICKIGNTCENYNQIKGIYGINYITPNYEYKYNYMCSNDVNYCNFKNCKIKPLEFYTYKDSKLDGGFDPVPIETKDLKQKLSDCDIKYDANLYTAIRAWFITEHDDNSNCNKLFEENFNDKLPVITCNPNYMDKCKDFIVDKEKICELKYLSKDNQYWLTYYKNDKTICPEIETLFMPIDLCYTDSSKPTA